VPEVNGVEGAAEDTDFGHLTILLDSSDRDLWTR
jgi:hypothetical protein